MAQTGGVKRHWLFDTQHVEDIGPILSKLVVYDTYFKEEEGQTTLQIVLDKILEELPDELEEAVRLIFLAGMSQRSAARTIGVDHKTVKARADKGVKILRKQLTDTVWLTSLLNGMLPTDSEEIKTNSPEKVFKVLNGLTEIRSNND
jgi:predicted DNA-binding protein (UPF0251 family)